MQPLPLEFNPFALMLDPQSVLAKIEHSERLERLSRRVCRPLDKPLLGGADQTDGDAEGEGADDSLAGLAVGLNGKASGESANPASTA